MPLTRRHLLAAGSAVLAGGARRAMLIPERSLLDPYEPVGPLALAPGSDQHCLSDHGFPLIQMDPSPEDAEDLDSLIFRAMKDAVSADLPRTHLVGTLAEFWAALIFVFDRMADQGSPAANVFVAESFARWVAKRAAVPAPVQTQFARWRGVPFYQSRRVLEYSALIVASPERAGRLVSGEGLVGVAVLPNALHLVQIV